MRLTIRQIENKLERKQWYNSLYMLRAMVGNSDKRISKLESPLEEERIRNKKLRKLLRKYEKLASNH